MKEYIDREELKKELECGIRAGNYEDGYENYAHINDIDDCVDTVKYFDKADVIEREKIGKAVSEIIDKSFISNIYNDRTDDEIVKLDDVIEILRRTVKGENE